jgi:uncharacterized protein YybS (DUF2232 family)
LLKAFQDERQRNLLAGIAFSTLLCALAVAAPILGFFCFLLLPAPVIFYRIKLGRKPAWIIIFSSLFLITLFMGGLAGDIFFLMGIMGLGYFIGEWIEKGLPVEKIIGYACGQIFIAALFGLIIYGNITNIDPVGVISDYIGKNFDLTISLYKEMGMPDDKLRIILAAKEAILRILIRIVPGLFATGLLFTAWMNFLLSRVMLQKKNIQTLAGAPLIAWKAPEQLVWGMIGSFLLLLIPVEMLKIAGLNGLIIFMTIYFFQGIAIVSFYLEKKKIPVPLRVLFYGLIGIQQILALMVIGLGFFDVWINFRRIGINNNHQ